MTDDDVIAKQIRSGLKGIAADIQGLLLGVMVGGLVSVGVISGAVFYAICLYVVLARLAGSTSTPDNQVVLAGVVVGLGLIAQVCVTAIKFHRALPAMLMKRGQAYERDQKAQQARVRLAARGAYTDSRRNTPAESARK